MEIVNTIAKWHDASGPEWTVSRLKSYKQWYLSTLTGEIKPPSWVRKSSDGMPTGIWSRVFKLRNPARVFAILSSGTVFKGKHGKFTPSQEMKFRTALQGDKSKVSGVVGLPIHHIEGLLTDRKINGEYLPRQMIDVRVPGTGCITGSSIPIANGVTIHNDFTRDVVNEAYLLSWEYLPHETVEYLDRVDVLDHIPLSLRTSYDGFSFRGHNEVGKISIIQEPELKARTVANPNRIAQAYTYPLGKLWYKCLGHLWTDCTYNQGAGISWVQSKLSQGIELSGSDLSSATDLLDLQTCISVVGAALSETSFPKDYRYQEDVRYFVQLSRGYWNIQTENPGTVRWVQGQPLGLYPSFALLGLTNNLIGWMAAKESGLNPYDSFRVIGDDISMDSRMQSNYENYIAAFGGSINHSKTVTSSKIAEFAGRIIEPSRFYLKTVKFCDPSDNNFMEVVSTLGPRAKGILKPRQRKMWEVFKYVPGLVVDGPWSQDSFGVPLALRYDWYYNNTGLVHESFERDQDKIPMESNFLRMQTLGQKGSTDSKELCEILPYPLDADYLSALVDRHPKKRSGDPRLKDGKTQLEWLEEQVSHPAFRDFGQYLASQ